jgi:very-short-patch-repair endonuclease
MNMINFYNDNLHKGATGKLYEYGRNLRKESTLPEDILWQRLRNRQLNGMKFRRQHPLDKFIADFYCHEKKIVIEIDGSIHDNADSKEYDKGRTYELNELQITVVRFSNEEVLNNIDAVLKKVLEITESLKL